MPSTSHSLRDQARAIWQAGVDAVNPLKLVRDALLNPEPALRQALDRAKRVLVVGGGKAGAPMAAGVEAALTDRLDTVTGMLNVPAQTPNHDLQRIRLHPARPVGTNQPTAQGVVGTTAILDLIGQAEPDDLVLCLLSGGGSALLPAPAEGISLEDKQAVTALLHRCGATIDEMNCVRKHLSRFKGGRLAQAFAGKGPMFSLIISDVIGDPLDVIASGPTAPDPTTFADALAILDRHGLTERVTESIRQHLHQGISGSIPDTPQTLPTQVHNRILGNNRLALDAACQHAQQLGYTVVDLGSFIEGETQQVARVLAGVVRSIRQDGQPCRPPVVLLCGGETTVTLPLFERGEIVEGKAPPLRRDPQGRSLPQSPPVSPPGHGLGGRNQEFVLASALHLGFNHLRNLVILSGGTDGEDGPTDAAGALADHETAERVRQLGLDPADYLRRHDSYHFFQAVDDLLQTGLTHTNVMDLRLFLVGD